MKFNETNRGYQAANDAGRPVAVVTTRTEGQRGQPPTLGVPAKPAVPPEALPQEAWTFEFVGRPISLAELKDMIAGLPGK